MIRKLTADECQAAIAAGDFSPAITASAAFAALVLTQSWCPQWTWMRRYLDDLATDSDTAIYWVEYDKETFFEDFLDLKEGRYGNRQIPYVRYYRNGILVHESNYIDRSGFLRSLKG
ncbi:MAG: hypothetical protein WC820_01290 [Spirochaetales bacterium]|jgi:hypothetical protein